MISGDIIDFVNDLRAYQTRLEGVVIVIHGSTCSQHFQSEWNEVNGNSESEYGGNKLNTIWTTQVYAAKSRSKQIQMQTRRLHRPSPSITLNGMEVGYPTATDFENGCSFFCLFDMACRKKEKTEGARSSSTCPCPSRLFFPSPLPVN